MLWKKCDKIVIPDMASSTHSCELCKLSGQLKGKIGVKDPIVELLRIAKVVFLPWGGREEPVNCQNLTRQELWDKLERFVDDWSKFKKSSSTNLSSKLDEAEKKAEKAIRCYN